MEDRQQKLLSLADVTRGFMPHEEGLELFSQACEVAVEGPFLEVGSYCGKSSLYLGAAAEMKGRVLFALDHHRGSEENQPGWECHEPDLVDSRSGCIDTLPYFRRTILEAKLEDTVVAVVGESSRVAAMWDTSLSLLFIEGGHGAESAHRDYESWVPHVVIGGLLLIHDVFPNPIDGGRPPYEIWCRAVDSKDFVEVSSVGSLRVMRRTPVVR